MTTNNVSLRIHREHDNDGNEIDLAKREALMQYLREHAQELHEEIERISENEDEDGVEEDIAHMYELMDREDALMLVVGLANKTNKMPSAFKINKARIILSKYVEDIMKQFNELFRRKNMDGEGADPYFAARIRDARWMLNEID